MTPSENGTFAARHFVTSGSWRLRSGFNLQSISDAPSDFPVPVPESLWVRAIFIPSDRQDTSRPDSYPPRIYVLTQNSLAIFSHPMSDECHFLAKIADLVEVGCYRAPLFGALELSASDARRSFRYGVVQHPYMDSLLRSLRSLWLHPSRMEDGEVDLSKEKPELSQKCRHVLENEFDVGENILRVCFQPARGGKTRRFLITTSLWMSAFWLILTDRRLMLIAYGEGSSNDSSSMSVRYASRSDVEVTLLERTDDPPGGFRLQLRICKSRAWDLCIEKEQASSLFALLNHLPCLVEGRIRLVQLL